MGDEVDRVDEAMGQYHWPELAADGQKRHAEDETDCAGPEHALGTLVDVGQGEDDRAPDQCEQPCKSARACLEVEEAANEVAAEQQLLDEAGGDPHHQQVDEQVG